MFSISVFKLKIHVTEWMLAMYSISNVQQAIYSILISKSRFYTTKWIQAMHSLSVSINYKKM